MNRKILGILGTIIVIIIVGITFSSGTNEKQSKLDLLLEEAQIELDRIQNADNTYLFPADEFELFYVYVYDEHWKYNEDGTVRQPEIMNFIPKKEFKETFEEIGHFISTSNTAVIIPTFTANAYKENGFYSYYDGSCDKECLTVSIQDKTSGFTSSDNAVKILKFLQYEMITDVDVDNNPDILKDYDKVIVLHNEYVTKKEFSAITGHSNVIFLYPNALYAEIELNYEDNTMTLKRGHNYPEESIKNGFGWENDNSPMEYDQTCQNSRFYEISNGWMFNCYPENPKIIGNKILLKSIKEI